MTFTYVSGNSTNVNIGMGVRVSAAGGTINTYPTYRVLLAGGNFTLQKNYSFNGTTDVGTYTLGSTLGSTNVYQMDLSAVDIGVNGFGKIVSLTASLYENGGLLQSLSYTDTPTQNYGPTAGASIGSGYIGMYAGEAGISTGTFRGISISQFSVGVPEPSVFALVGMAAAALGLACRRKRNDATLGPRRDVRREG